MGLCHGKSVAVQEPAEEETQVAAGAAPPAAGRDDGVASPAKAPATPKQPKFSFYLPSPLPPFSYKGSPANSSVTSTPARKRPLPFPPPSPAKHIRALLARRHGSIKPNEASIPEGAEPNLGLDKTFGYSKHFTAKYELGREVGRGHFGYTCAAKAKKGELKGEDVAVKVVPKAKVREHSLFPWSDFFCSVPHLFSLPSFVCSIGPSVQFFCSKFFFLYSLSTPCVHRLLVDILVAS